MQTRLAALLKVCGQLPEATRACHDDAAAGRIYVAGAFTEGRTPQGSDGFKDVPKAAPRKWA
jgi:hypothetical protein